MAQKAAKTLAARNASLLLRTHITSLSLHVIFHLIRYLFNRPRSLLLYALFAGPTLLIQFYFERLGRPRYNAADGSLRSAGEDLDSAGLTEYFWDVTYWTWGCIGAVCIFGDKGWWLWVIVPLYSLWLGYTTFIGVKQGFSGMGAGGGAQGGGGGEQPQESKRQKKLEKRGGQRMKYR